MLDAGNLNRRVTILAPTRTPNSVGEQMSTWAVVATRWASVTPIRSGEIARARAAELSTTHRVSMRFTPLVKPDCRLTYKAAGNVVVTLEIIGIVDVGNRHDELEIMAVARG